MSAFTLLIDLNKELCGSAYSITFKLGTQYVNHKLEHMAKNCSFARQSS